MSNRSVTRNQQEPVEILSISVGSLVVLLRLAAYMSHFSLSTFSFAIAAVGVLRSKSSSILLSVFETLEPFVRLNFGQRLISLDIR